MTVQLSVQISDINSDWYIDYMADFEITIEVDYEEGEIEYLRHWSSHKIDKQVIRDYAETDSCFHEWVDGYCYEKKHG